MVQDPDRRRIGVCASHGTSTSRRYRPKAVQSDLWNATPDVDRARHDTLPMSFNTVRQRISMAIRPARWRGVRIVVVAVEHCAWTGQAGITRTG